MTYLANMYCTKKNKNGSIKIKMKSINDGIGFYQKNKGDFIMIYDSIKNKERYKDMPKLYEALCYLETLTPENFTENRITLDGIKKFVVRKDYDTESTETAPYEVHHIRADIHYMLVGTEGVQTGDEAELTPIKGGYVLEKDCGEVEGHVDGTYWIKPGYFALVLPYEAHKTGIMVDKPERILKAVYKYQVED